VVRVILGEGESGIALAGELEAFTQIGAKW